MSTCTPSEKKVSVKPCTHFRVWKKTHLHTWVGDKEELQKPDTVNIYLHLTLARVTPVKRP